MKQFSISYTKKLTLLWLETSSGRGKYNLRLMDNVFCFCGKLKSLKRTIVKIYFPYASTPGYFLPKYEKDEIFFSA
jgi:hypothetical protein